ncbi:ATP-binding cassette domain-containing protein [Virgibacillus sp. DJP39]|uniref:ATP-binding cassette domain-containing protein n=1 Tax=Virgibacillus sp. DJP39 TaxID=3409790 RepID=UPI003BB78313
MNIIECTNLTKKHGRTIALNGISMSITENKITGLIGANGAGKTTLLKIIAGFWRKTSGDIKVFSEQPFNNIKTSANTIFIDDQMDLPTSLTLLEILHEAGRLYEKWDKDLAFRLLDYFSFNPNQFHSRLSKGKKSTFNIILGLASRCSLTIFDEPTTGMDASVRKDFCRALLKDYLAHPRSIIISSHYLEEMEDILEDIILIENGKKRLHLSVDEVREYAIGATGETININVLIQNREVIYSKNLGSDHTYVVLKHNFSEEELESAREAGLTLSPIPSSDLCIYLTNKKAGGIDDVFNRT